MTIHASVLALAKRLDRYVPLAGLLAAAAFFGALVHCVYPGRSAALVAAAAGLTEPLGASHPFFSLVTRGLAACDFLGLPTRMNLLSALCGPLCAMLLYRLVSRTVLFYACEDAGGGGQTAILGDAVKERGGLDLPPEVERFNRRLPPVAMAGGLFAAYLFAFGAATWSAGTRLDCGLFDLLLALSAFSLLPRGKTPSRFCRLAFAVLLFVLGLHDSAVFLLLAPSFAVLSFKAVWFTRQRVAMGLVALVAMALGIVCAFACYRINATSGFSGSLLEAARAYAQSLPASHYRELRTLFPKMGWGWLVLQNGVLIAVLLFGKRLLFKKRQSDTVIALLLVTLAAAPGLLTLDCSPFSIYQLADHLPVFSATLLAATAALAASACLVLLIPDEQAADAEAPKKKRPKPMKRLMRAAAACVLASLAVLSAAAPLVSYRVSHRHSTAFADAAAREVLAAMGPREWLISNGHLDNHLMIQARMSGQPLHLVTLSANPPPYDRAQLRRLIKSHPAFSGQNRQRLQNALSINMVRFVIEWFSRDPKACEKAMVWGTPDLWAACGHRAVAEGLAFGGLRAGEKANLAAAKRQGRSLTHALAPLLGERVPDTGYHASLREMLRLKASLVLNELGVLLEDEHDPEGAFEAYMFALQIDPMNLSAALNGHALVSAQSLHPEAVDQLRRRVKTIMSGHRYPVLGLDGVLQTYGIIRQPAFYQQQAAMWSSLGLRSAARDRSRHALSLSARTGVQALLENAAFYVDAENAPQAETCYRSALELDPSNAAALSGLCLLLATSGRTDEAEAWLQKAKQRGVGKDLLILPSVRVALLKGESDRAVDLLEEATKSHPADPRYWTLLADVLLDRGDTHAVEFRVLPRMQKALENPNHYLVHATRGYLQKKKGVTYYNEARLSLLKALSQNAALPRVWDAVLEMDAAVGSLELITSDARSVLSLDPDHAFANYIMGAAALARDALGEAEDFLRRSIEKSPTAAACNDLAECLRQMRRLPEAEQRAQQALSLDPAFPCALDTLANVRLDAGRTDEAAGPASEAVAARPLRNDFKITLLRVRAAQGDAGDADRLLRQLDQSRAHVPDELRKRVGRLPRRAPEDRP